MMPGNVNEFKNDKEHFSKMSKYRLSEFLG
jgi:hypothetical protein